MIEIELNGKKIQAQAGQKIIELTDDLGVEVPRFCYHKKLSIAANCRMCLVDVEGMPKPQPACSTPISEGMKIFTHNEKAKKSQKAVMEFLLINHPLDCPICDQGGECELQDVAMDYGSDVSFFGEGKRVITDNDIGALIQTDMTRCIHCTRCVRFGAEVAGIMEMGVTGRGEDLKIEPFLGKGIESELSGNMIDICPVGALTSKPFRYELRSWQMSGIANIARHDLVGSNVYAQTYKGKLKRVVARDNEAINETWIADRDRFSYEGLTHKNRALSPKIKVNGEWQEVEWEVALDFAIKGLESNVFNLRQTNRLAALATNTATLEEFYILQKLLHEVGSENIDYRLNLKNTAQAIHLESNIKLADLEEVDYALIVGSNLRLEQPMINHRLRKAVLNGAKVEVMNVMEFDFNYPLNNEYITEPNQLGLTLAKVLKFILQNTKTKIPSYLNKVKISPKTQQLAEQLLHSNNSVMILGEHIINNPQAANIAHLFKEIAKQTNSKTLNVSKTANANAADLAGFLPSKEALDVNAMLKSNLGAYILLDVYPNYDFYDSVQAIQALSCEDTFVISLNSFEDAAIMQCADVLLPIASFYETSGSHINIEGTMQSFSAAVAAPKQAKPAWKVLKVLADLLKLSGFNYANSTQITNKISHQTSKEYNHKPQIDLTTKAEIEIIWQKSPYAIDALLRHSDALQATKIGQLNNAWMNLETAKKLELTSAKNYLGVPILVSETVANNCVFIHTNQPSGAGL